jgi:uncharacterized protein
MTDEQNIRVDTPDRFSLSGLVVGEKSAEQVVIMCHGINSHKQEYLDMYPKLARRLAERGIASVRFDFRGHGDSSGASRDFSVISQLIDLAAIERWVQRTFGQQRFRPAYVGVSFGAAPGIFAAATASRYSSMTFVAPVLSYIRTFLKPETAWASNSFNDEAFQKANNSGYLLLDGTFEVSIRLLKEMEVLHPEVVIGQISEPILLIHGSADTLVPCAVSEDVARRFPQIELHVIEGMNHGLFLTGDDDGVSERSISIERDALDMMEAHISGNR